MSPALGWYPTPTPTGFVLHLSATPEHLRAVRSMVEKTLCGAGAGDDLAHAVQLVLSELCGNAVRACGDYVPLVAEVELETAEPEGTRRATAVTAPAAAPTAARVRLHDPCRAVLPRRTGVRLDDPYAECGRGMAIVDMLAPGWEVAATPVGKQVRCRVPMPGR